MPSPTRTDPDNAPRRRADAERNIAAIVDAALAALAGDPDASMAEIARQAGVVRATIYMHFPTREALIEAVTERAIAEVTEAIRNAEPERGEPAEALGRVLARAWQALGRFHSLVAINAGLPPAELHRLHKPVIELLMPLIKRGQRARVFRRRTPVSWHLATILALVHAASAELQAGRMSKAEVEPALLATVLAAISEPGV